MKNPLPVQHYVPEQTLQCYLDALLQDAAAELAQAEAVEPQAGTNAQPEPVVRAVPVSEPTSALSLVEVATDHPAPAPSPVEPVSTSTWRDEPFEALLFDVGGLTLAVPLISLGTIHPLEGPVTPLFGQPDWFLGILPTSAGNLKVLDTARWVMPERYRDELRNSLRFVISVQGHEWGMAVHGVSESIRLEPTQVKWRSGQGKRPWLAGTVIDHMCALLDVDALAQLISAGAGKPVDAPLG